MTFVCIWLCLVIWESFYTILITLVVFYLNHKPQIFSKHIFDSHIAYANVIWVQNFNAINGVLTLQKRPWQWLVLSHEIVIEAHCLKNTIYVNLKVKFNLKMHSLSVHTSTKYYYQYSTTGSHFFLICTITTQLRIPQALIAN